MKTEDLQIVLALSIYCMVSNIDWDDEHLYRQIENKTHTFQCGNIDTVWLTYCAIFRTLYVMPFFVRYSQH